MSLKVIYFRIRISENADKLSLSHIIDLLPNCEQVIQSSSFHIGSEMQFVC